MSCFYYVNDFRRLRLYGSDSGTPSAGQPLAE
jgi:hypothetical protein